MRFERTPLADVVVVEPERRQDARGYFARSFCVDEFAAEGLVSSWIQQNVSYNAKRGTLRGMHLQRPPHGETKLVRCTRGAVFDVVVDLRPGSPTLGGWYGTELSESNGRALYVPAGLAHGFLTLVDDAELLYLMSVRYVPEAASGVRWDDPAFGIDWPFAPLVISERDASFPDWTP